jgi:hypothetical protein
MKPLPGNHQLGLASPLKYAAIQSGENQKPLHEGDGAGCKQAAGLQRGKGKTFFLTSSFIG